MKPSVWKAAPVHSCICCLEDRAAQQQLTRVSEGTTETLRVTCIPLARIPVGPSWQVSPSLSGTCVNAKLSCISLAFGRELSPGSHNHSPRERKCCSLPTISVSHGSANTKPLVPNVFLEKAVTCYPRSCCCRVTGCSTGWLKRGSATCKPQGCKFQLLLCQTTITEKENPPFISLQYF